MLIGLRDIHNTGYVHCDIKPANLMFNKVGQETHLKFIDFGLSQLIQQIEGHVVGVERPRGTPNFMSINCHQGKILTMRDDLESIMYIDILLINSYLPWYNLSGEGEQEQILLKIKQEYWGPRLTQGLSDVFKQFVDIITNMGPNEMPPYDKLIELMMTVETKDGPKRLSHEDLYDISWNKYINKNCYNGFHNSKTVKFRNELGRFKFPRDDEMKDLDKLQQ